MVEKIITMKILKQFKTPVALEITTLEHGKKIFMGVGCIKIYDGTYYLENGNGNVFRSFETKYPFGYKILAVH